MAKLNIWPDLVVERPLETVHIQPGDSLLDYLEKVPGYREDHAPFEVKFNGVDLPQECWGIQVVEGDELDLHIQPHGLETGTIALIISVLSVGYSLYIASNIPQPQRPQDTPDSSPLLNPNAQGNRVRLGAVVPEHFGQFPCFPDVISQPYRSYVDNEQWLHIFLCVGYGEYDFSVDDIQIANTPISRYGSDVDVQIFAPGETVTGFAARPKYVSPEVGSSGGQSGIEIPGAVGELEIIAPDNAQLANSGGAYFQILLHENGSPYRPDFPFEIGEIFEWQGYDIADNDGLYRVDSYLYDEKDARVTKMLDATTEDPAWTGDWPTPQYGDAHGLMTRFGAGDESTYVGPILGAPEGVKSRWYTANFIFPRGLGEFDDNGNLNSKTVEIQVEYRDADLGDAQPWEEHILSWTDATTDQLGFTVALGFPLKYAMRAEFRIKRLTPETRNTKVLEEIQWTLLKAVLPEKSTYEGWTTVALSIKASGALATQAENKITINATRKLPVWDGNAWSAPVATRKLAPVVAYIAKDIGYTDDDIDLAGLNALQAIWDARGDTFDYRFDSPGVFWDALKTVLAVGFAEPLQDFGVLQAVRDVARTSYDEPYMPDSILEDGVQREWTIIDPDEPDGVEVEYFDVNTRKPETVLATLPGDQALDPEKLQVPGVTDRTRAWRLGMRQRRKRRYQRQRFSWSTGLDGLNSTRLSYCPVIDDQIQDAVGGLVVDANAGLTQLTLNQPVEFDGVSTYYAIIRRPNGSSFGPVVATEGPDDHTINIASSLDFTPDFSGESEPPHFAFGPGTAWKEDVLITEVRPTDEGAQLSAVKYDPRVYADDDNAPA